MPDTVLEFTRLWEIFLLRVEPRPYHLFRPSSVSLTHLNWTTFWDTLCLAATRGDAGEAQGPQSHRICRGHWPVGCGTPRCPALPPHLTKGCCGKAKDVIDTKDEYKPFHWGIGGQ